MKSIIAIAFSVFFLLSTMQQTTIFLLYKLNEKEITEKYCVNKNVAGSCCHGKCHLNKTIAKSEKENTSNPFATFNIKVKEVEIFCHKIQQITLAGLPANKVFNSFYRFALLDGVRTSLVKPPAILG